MGDKLLTYHRAKIKLFLADQLEIVYAGNSSEIVDISLKGFDW